MARQQEFIQKIRIEADMEIAGVKKGIEGIEGAFKGLKMDKGLESQLDKLKKDLGTFEKFNGKEIGNKMDASAFSKSWKTLAGDLDDISRKLEKMGLDPSKFIPNTTLTKLGQVQKTLDNLTKARTTRDTAISKLSQQSDEAKTKLEQLNKEKQELENGKYTDTGLKELEDQAHAASIQLKDLEKIKKEMSKTGTSEESVIADENYNKQKEYVQQLNAEIKNYQKNLQEVPSRLDTITKETENLESKTKEYDTQISDIKKKFREDWGSDSGLTKVREELSQFTDKDISHASLDQLKKLVEQLAVEAGNNAAPKIAKLGETLEELSGEAKNSGRAVSDIGNNFDDTIDKSENFSNQVKSLTNQITNFFSLTNGWYLLRRAISSAVDVVKELDEAMTGIAVVSEYDLSDIWGKRGDFSKQATEIGVTTLDLVNATTLYTQQGLELEDAMQVATETMKMGRIAGLEGEEATNLMTAALRGYNMELSEAAHVNDVYSNLAAKSASNQEQLATAMSKTASIAYNSGASFENMSAFLAQIIETTQEAPETAGTAMKTIIARFQELKKPLSEIGEVEGEVVDANKIEGALRLAGVALRDAKGEFRDFDDVILELSSKWNTLDKMTQRYIATQAAGSRQQSRFLALLDNNERLLELTGYAADSAGKSQEQFNKTTESLQSKLNKLHNELDQFYTNLMNSNVVKMAVDFATKLLEAINAIITPLSNSENLVANFGGALLEAAGMGALFFLALKSIRAAAAKATKGLVTLGIVTEAETKAVQKGSTSLLANLVARAKSNIEKRKQIKLTALAAAEAQELAWAEGTEAEASIIESYAKKKQAIETRKATIAQEMFNIAILKNPVFWMVAAVIALVTAYGLLVTKERRAYESSKKHTEELKEKAEETRQSYEDLQSTLGNYKNGLEGLEELKRGTDEFKQAVQDSNAEAKELIETLGLFGDYTVNSDGLITINEESLAEALAKKEKETIEAEMEHQQSAIDTARQGIDASIEGFVHSNKTFNARTQAHINEANGVFEDPNANTRGNFTETGTYNALEQGEKDLDKYIRSIMENMASVWEEGQKDLLDLTIGKVLDGVDLTNEEEEMLNSVFGKGWENNNNALIKAYDANRDKIEEMTQGYIDSTNEIKSWTHALMKSELLLSQGEKIKDFAEENSTEEKVYSEDAIAEAIVTATEHELEVAGLERDTEEWDEAYSKAMEANTDRMLNGLIDINKSNALSKYNLTDIIESAMYGEELTAEGLIISEENLEALKNGIISAGGIENYLGDEIVAHLEALGANLEEFENQLLTYTLPDIKNTIASQAGEYNTKAKTAQSDIEEGKLSYGSLVNGEYGEEETTAFNSFLQYVTQVAEVYTELVDEAEILNQKWLIGTQQYSLALDEVQRKISELEVANLQNELQTMYSDLAAMDFKANLDDSEVQAKIKEIEEQEHLIQFKIEEQASNELTKLQNLGTKAGRVFDILKEDFAVTNEELQEILEVYPEAVKYVGDMVDGEWQLSESIKDGAVAALDEQMATQQEALNSHINNLIDRNNAEIAFWEGLLDIANKNGENQVITDDQWNDAMADNKDKLREASIKIEGDKTKGILESASQVPLEEDKFAEQSATAAADGATASVQAYDTAGSKLAQIFQQYADMGRKALNPTLAAAKEKTIGPVSITYSPVAGEGIVSTYQSHAGAFSLANIGSIATAVGKTAAAAAKGEDYYLAGQYADLMSKNAKDQRQYIKDQIAALKESNLRLKGMKKLGEGARQEALNKGSNIGSGSGSGGGGGGSSENPWIADYDWLYNLLQKINAEEKKMNKLEKERERLLRNQSLNVKKMTDNYKARMDLVKQEKMDNQALLAGRMQEMVNLQSRNKDMLKYGYYDQEEGYFKINYDAIMAVSGQISESEGKLIDEYIKEGEKLSEDIQDINETIDDLKDEEYKIWEQGHSAMADLEQGVIDGMVSEREKEIEKLEQVYDSINEANQNIIDALNSGIEEYRNQRELDRQLEDIQDQESRIALMSMDTSGANQLDILNAQKELDDARENYTDSLIDKSIEQMTEQNERAEEQRQHQIDLMTAQLEWDKESGLIVSLMEKLLTAAENGDDNALKEIQRLLNDGKTWKELANMVGKATLDNMKSETKGKVEDAIGWHLANHSLERLDNFDDLIKKKISFTDKNGKTVSGKVQSDGSVKTSDYKYTGIYQGVDGKYYQSDEGAKTKIQKTTNTSSTKDTKDTKDSSKEKTTTVSKNATKRTMDKYGWSETEDINHGIAEVIMTYGGEGSGWGNGSTRDSRINAKNKNQASKVQSLINQMSSGQISGHWHEPDELKKYFYAKFETGGLADFTGPAWLDGTKSKPEYVLNAEQTQKFFDLLDFTRNIATDSKSTSLGDTYVTVQMNNEISSDYDVDEMWEEMKRKIAQESNYRNVNVLDFNRR